VHLEIFDLRGRRVRSLVSGETLPAGTHERAWQGLDERGHTVASGVYLYRLRADQKVRVERMLLLR
jgi:flagellar hook assembly protein FlgD